MAITVLFARVYDKQGFWSLIIKPEQQVRGKKENFEINDYPDGAGPSSRDITDDGLAGTAQSSGRQYGHAEKDTPGDGEVRLYSRPDRRRPEN